MKWDSLEFRLTYIYISNVEIQKSLPIYFCEYSAARNSKDLSSTATPKPRPVLTQVFTSYKTPWKICTPCLYAHLLINMLTLSLYILTWLSDSSVKYMDEHAAERGRYCWETDSTSDITTSVSSTFFWTSAASRFKRSNWPMILHREYARHE